MRIMLINPQYVEGYIHSARWDGLTISGSHWYPIFLAYCTGLLEKYGHKCKLIDAEADNLLDNQIFSIAKKFNPDFTVIYISKKGLKQNVDLSERIKKETDSKIIFVGPWASMEPKNILKNKVVNYLIDGEFEYTVKDIVEGKIKKRYLKTKRLTKKQLEELPWVTKVYKRHLNIKNYKIGSLWHPFVDTFTGRKCYWSKCTFCLWPFTNLKEGGYIVRDIEDVLDEIDWVSKNLPIKEIFIQDDTLPGWRAKQIAEGILRRGIKIRWSAYARGDLSMTPKILKLMRKSGCHCLHIGYESSSNKILRNVNKGVTKEDLEKFTKWVNDAGIDIHGDFMVGLPGETKETIRDTIEWAKKLNIVTYQFAPPKAYPCTPYYEELKRNSHLDENDKLKLPNMSYSEIEMWCKRAMRECYFNFGFLRRVIFKPRELKRLLRSSIYVVPHIFSKSKSSEVS
ncbi:MAG: B12-binding domain-containing radical SAM protein [Candidatus Aenigmatarchaeota archaeon]